MEWDDSLEEIFVLRDDTHANVVQYWCKNNEKFFCYLPKDLVLRLGRNKIPNYIVVHIRKATGPRETVGFKPKKIGPQAGFDFCEYDLERATSNFTRYLRKDAAYGYDKNQKLQKYSLYLPNAILGTKTPPERLFVSVKDADKQMY